MEKRFQKTGVNRVGRERKESTMDMGSPASEVFMLEDLRLHWQASIGQLKLWLTRGDLVSSVWLPVMSVYRTQDVIAEPQIEVARELCHWEGYIPLSRHFCYRVFKRGKACLRDFACTRSRQHFILPDSAESIDVELSDLVVLKEERMRFESEFGDLGLSFDADGCFALDSSFKIVRCGGEDYRLGDMQAKILCLLRDAAENGKPWQSGKRLLQEVGSLSFTLSNVFKHNPIWRELVISDRRGFYRLDPKWIKPSGGLNF